MRTRPWHLHAFCALVIAAELVFAWGRHQSDAELRVQAGAGSTQERLDALHILTNRGEPDPSMFSPESVAALLRDPDDRIREFAFTNDVCKFHVPDLQNAYLRATTDYPHWWRATLLHRRKVGGPVVGGGVTLSRVELAWYDEALRDLTPPMDAVMAHLRRISDHSRRRQSALGIVPGRTP